MITNWTSEGMDWTDLVNKPLDRRYAEALRLAHNERVASILDLTEVGQGVANYYIIDAFGDDSPWTFSFAYKLYLLTDICRLGSSTFGNNRLWGFVDADVDPAGDTDWAWWDTDAVESVLGHDIISPDINQPISAKFWKQCYTILNLFTKFVFRAPLVDLIHYSDGNETEDAVADAKSSAKAEYDADGTGQTGIGLTPRRWKAITQLRRLSKQTGSPTFEYDARIHSQGMTISTANWANGSGFDRDWSFYVVPTQIDNRFVFVDEVGTDDVTENEYEDIWSNPAPNMITHIETLANPDGDTGTYDYDIIPTPSPLPNATSLANAIDWPPTPADVPDVTVRGWWIHDYGFQMLQQHGKPRDDTETYGPYVMLDYAVANGFQFLPAS